MEELSKTDLKEVDFYKRREQYYEKQMSSNSQEIKKLKNILN